MRVFNSDDILINVVLGAVIIFTILYFTRNIDYITTSGSVLIVAIAIVAFVLVEMSTTTPDQPSWYPPLFRETVILSQDPTKIEQEQDRETTFLDKIPNFRSIDRIEMTRSKREFWSIVERKYSLNDDFDEYTELYRLIMHSLEPLNRRTCRERRLYVFYRNLSISVSTVCFMVLYAFVALVSEEITLSILSIYGILLLIFVALIIISFSICIIGSLWKRSRRAEQEFLNELMAEFYQQEYQENGPQKNRILSEYE